MARKRGSSHTTLTETADSVVRVLEKMSGIKMIAPGIITTKSRKGSGGRFITIVYTHAGFELIITGQGVQKVAVHLHELDRSEKIITSIKKHRDLKLFEWNERHKKPGI